MRATKASEQQTTKGETMMGTTNNQECVELINASLKSIKAPFFCMVGKRSLSWFQAYTHGGGAYSTSIGVVRQAVTGITADLDGLSKIISKAEMMQFAE